jgi:hypothetical protein
MRYELIEKEDVTIIHVFGKNIFFAWDPNDLDNYGNFIQKLEEKGIESFAQLLADNPNTAFNLFCQ